VDGDQGKEGRLSSRHQARFQPLCGYHMYCSRRVAESAEVAVAPAAMAPAAVAPAAVAPAVGVAVAVVGAGAGAGAVEAGDTAPEVVEGEGERFAVPQYSWSIVAAAAAAAVVVVDTAPGDFAVAWAVYYDGQEEAVRTELPASR